MSLKIIQVNSLIEKEGKNHTSKIKFKLPEDESGGRDIEQAEQFESPQVELGGQ
jgi:hypothetical protein